MSFLVFDIEQLYRQTFGGRPYVIETKNNVPADDQYSKKSLIKTKYLNKEIWLPTKFFGLSQLKSDSGNSLFSFDELLLPYTAIKISGKKTMTKTSLAERTGSVKELYNLDDYDIVIKGFAIDEDRIFPEQQVEYLKGIHESGQSIGLDNALTNIFLADQGCQVAVESIDFTEVTGGRKHVRPFSLTMCSDSIFNLIVE